MEELLSLKWNNHRSTFLHILGVLRDKQSYTDVTLACDGKFYSVHKLVLSTCSDYFCAMFEKTSCKSPVIVLKDIKSEDLEALLDYMYLGEVNVRQSDLASLIKAAENLRIKGLAVPDDEPPKKSSSSSSGGGVSAPSRRDSSPPAKRKRRAESEDGREDVRPSGGGDLHTPPPPSRPKSPAIQRLSPSPHRTPQESRATEDRDNRPLPSPAETTPTPHSQAQVSQQSLQSAQQLGDPGAQTMGNNQYGAENPPYVKVEVDEEDTDGANRDSFDMSSESFKEEGDVGGSLSNDLPEFLQQAASSALAGTSGSYHQSFAGPSGFQPEVSSWHADGQSMPGNFPGMNFPANTSQDNPPGTMMDGGAILQSQDNWPSTNLEALNVLPAGSQAKQFTTQGMVVPSTSKRRHHQYIEGDMGGIPSVKCPTCFKVFSGPKRRYHLDRHIITHTGEKPYPCPHCRYRANVRENMIRHVRYKHPEVFANSPLTSAPFSAT